MKDNKSTKLVEPHLNTITTNLFVEYINLKKRESELKKLFRGILDEENLVSSKYYYKTINNNKKFLDLKFFTTPNNYYSQEIDIILFNNMKKLGFDLYDVGIFGAKKSKFIQTSFIRGLAYLMGPKKTIKRINEISKIFNKLKKTEIIELKKNSGKVKISYKKNLGKTIELISEYNRGWMVGILESIGFKIIYSKVQFYKYGEKNYSIIEFKWKPIPLYKKILKIKDYLVLLILTPNYYKIQKEKIKIQKKLIEYLRIQNKKNDELIKNLNKKEKKLEKTYEIIKKYVSPQIIYEIENNKNPINYKLKEKNLAILFSDIRDFTSISEKINSLKLVSLLNEYYNFCIPIYIKYNGTVDKILGDGILAHFESADNAFKSSKEILNKLNNLNKKLKDKYNIKINIGFGLNYGSLIICNLGCKDYKIERTIIGDSVNITSRIENLNKKYNSKILMSKEFKENLSNTDNIKFLEKVNLKGKKNPTEIYEYLFHKK